MCQRCERSFVEEDLSTGHSWTVIEPIEPIFNNRGTIIGQMFCSYCGVGFKAQNTEEGKDANNTRHKADSPPTP